MAKFVAHFDTGFEEDSTLRSEGTLRLIRCSSALCDSSLHNMVVVSRPGRGLNGCPRKRFFHVGIGIRATDF